MTALDQDQYYNDMQYVYDRLAKLEEFRENFERNVNWKIDQAYFASQDFYDFKNRTQFAFVDIKKS